MACRVSSAWTRFAATCGLSHPTDDHEKSFPLFKLPRDIRLMVWEHMFTNHPLRLDHDGRLHHPLLHRKLAPLVEDASSALFHTAPILVLSDKSPDLFDNDAFLIWHDAKCDRAQRHRIKLRVVAGTHHVWCLHIRCILRPFRCPAEYVSRRECLERWSPFRERTGIPLKNFLVEGPDPRLGNGPFVDWHKLRFFSQLIAITSLLPVMAIWHLGGVFFVNYILRIDVHAEEYYQHVKRQQQLHGWWGAVKAYLRCATVAFAVLFLWAILAVEYGYAAGEEKNDAFVCLCGSLMPVLGVASMVWR